MESSVLAERDPRHKVERVSVLEGVQKVCSDALVLVAQVDIQSRGLPHHVPRERSQGPADPDRMCIRAHILRNGCKAEVVVEGRRSEPEDEDFVGGAAEPRFDLRVRRVPTVRVEEADFVPSRPDECGKLQQAVRLEHGVSLCDLAPFLTNDGHAIESGRVHERDLQAASPSRTCS